MFAHIPSNRWKQCATCVQETWEMLSWKCWSHGMHYAVSGMVPACSPWTGVGYTAPGTAFGEGSSAHPQHLQSAPESGSLCAHTEGGVRSSLPWLQSLPKMTHWICPAMAQVLSGINVSCKIRGSFLVRQWIWNTATAVYNARKNSLFSNKAINEVSLMVHACPNASVSGGRDAKECWSLLQVNFGH